MTDKIDDNELDIEKGRRLRDEGMATAENHAEAVVPEWKETARLYFEVFLKTHALPFMVEEVRKWASERGCPVPPSLRAWGGVAVGFVKAGKIRRLTYKSVANPRAHCAPCSVWLRTQPVVPDPVPAVDAWADLDTDPGEDGDPRQRVLL